MIKIITDSSADVPDSFAKKYNISVMPMVLTFGEESFFDRVNISNGQFYERLTHSEEFPQTAYPPLGLYKDALDKAVAAGEEIIVITISSALSGCFQAVNLLAAEYDYDKITVVDAKSTTATQGAVVLEVARLVEQGLGYEDVLAKIPSIVDRAEGYGAVSNLEYLAKGGRMNTATAKIATALNVKPIIEIVHDGTLDCCHKTRGMVKVQRYMLDRVAGDGTDYSKSTIFVGHINDPEAAEKWAAALTEKFGVGEIIIHEISATVGAHLGPGCIGFFYLRPEN